MLRKSLYGLGVLLFLVGLWGFWARLTSGHEPAAYGSYVVWGLWVAEYAFFSGLAGGLLAFAALDIVFKLRWFAGLGRLALFAALVSLGTGLFFIWVDLGHPVRIWKVFLTPNFTSVMTQIVWGYSLFGLVTLVSLIIALRSGVAGSILKVLLGFELVLALFLSGGIGALFGVMGSRPFWHAGLLPVQFPVYAIGSAAAALLVIVGLFGDKNDPHRPTHLWTLALITTGGLLGKLYFAGADYTQSLYAGIPHSADAVNLVLFGPYWWAFWLLQILSGSLIPLAILVWPRVARNGGWAAIAGFLVLVGFVVARVNIVLPALAVPEIEALANAFVDARLQFVYFPSAMEWLVSAGVIGLAGIVFLIGLDRLPLGLAAVSKAAERRWTLQPNAE